MYDIRIDIRAEFLLQFSYIHRKIFYFIFHGFLYDFQIQRYHHAVIMRKRHLKSFYMGQPPIQFHISSFHIRKCIFSGRIFQPPLSAIIDTKNILIRYKCRVIIVHVKIIVCNDHTGKNIIRCNSSFSRFIFEMKHTTIIFIPVVFLIHSIHFIYTSRKCSFINSRNSASAVQNTL